MITLRRLASLTALGLLAAGLAGCMHAEDSITQYFERTDKVVMSAGNANNANAAMQIIDPWPRVSANRRIASDGARMSGAYERYRDVTKVQPRPLITPPIDTSATGTSGIGAPTAGGAR